MRQEQLALRDFHKFSSGVTPAIGNARMRPEDARKNVHFHQFFYRINADKTIDAICAFCYMTAATAATRTELEVKERAHRCPRS
jgi:hypothetical protein